MWTTTAGLVHHQVPGQLCHKPWLYTTKEGLRPATNIYHDNRKQRQWLYAPWWGLALLKRTGAPDDCRANVKAQNERDDWVNPTETDAFLEMKEMKEIAESKEWRWNSPKQIWWHRGLHKGHWGQGDTYPAGPWWVHCEFWNNSPAQYPAGPWWVLLKSTHLFTPILSTRSMVSTFKKYLYICSNFTHQAHAGYF